MLHGGRGVQTRRMTRVHTFQSVEQMLARRALPRSTAAAGRPSPRSTTKPAGGGAQQQIIGQGASEPVEGGGEAARPGRFWPVPPTPSTSASSGSAGASASPGTVTGEAAPDAARHSSLIDMDAEGRGTKGRKVKGRWETRCLLVRGKGRFRYAPRDEKVISESATDKVRSSREKAALVTEVAQSGGQQCCV